MSVVGLVVHGGREAAVSAASDLRTRLTAEGVDTVELADALTPADLVVSVGGDGTFLRAASLAARLDVPVLGVKVGRMGFLTEVEPDEADRLIIDALAGSARIEDRLAVVAEPVDDGTFEPEWALNEVMVEKATRHRVIRLRVEVDGEYVTTFSADGVIVATPTGSTAYSFSARGPIVSPEVDCLVLTPIAPHMVFDRSIVLAPDQVVTVEVVGEEPGVVSADGSESQEIPVGTKVRIRASLRPVRFVRRSGDAAFLSRVRDKFQLPSA